jgi:hypothetical protein
MLLTIYGNFEAGSISSDAHATLHASWHAPLPQNFLTLGLTSCDGQAEGRVRVDPQSQHASKLLAVYVGVVVVPPPSSLTG